MHTVTIESSCLMQCQADVTVAHQDSNTCQRNCCRDSKPTHDMCTSEAAVALWLSGFVAKEPTTDPM